MGWKTHAVGRPASETNFKLKHIMQLNRTDGIQLRDFFGSIFMLYLFFYFHQRLFSPGCEQ